MNMMLMHKRFAPSHLKMQSYYNQSVFSLPTSLLSNALTAWFPSKLEQTQQQLQALVALPNRQVDIGADSAQSVQKKRQ